MFENMQASAQGFYSDVTTAIEKRQIPDIYFERVDWKESSFLSADREYLRVIRGRYVYDICAAPFGNGFFFSSWMAERLPSPLIASIALMVAPIVSFWVLLVFIYAGGTLGFLFWGASNVVGLTLFIVALTKESAFADHFFVVPYIGPVLEETFRPNTYFRSDTEAMFRSMAHNAVLEAVDATTKAKGARELTSDERKPVLREFFQR